MDAIHSRAASVLAATWAGMLLTIALVAAPALFATLDRTLAGQVAGSIFSVEAKASLALAIVLFLLERRQAERRAQLGAGSRVSGSLLLVLGALFCTVLGHFALQPLMQQARVGQGAWSFADLHLASTVIYGFKTLLVLLLAWRLSDRGR